MPLQLLGMLYILSSNMQSNLKYSYPSSKNSHAAANSLTKDQSQNNFLLDLFHFKIFSGIFVIDLSQLN